uniref:Uncharacterized protein n=1 Tax=Oryza meridionalis TaxID=40149 RepID=A0A0E0ESE5_9ORYZ
MASARSSPRCGATGGEVGSVGDWKVDDGSGGAGPTEKDAWAEKTRTRGGGAEEDARRMGKKQGMVGWSSPIQLSKILKNPATSILYYEKKARQSHALTESPG